MGLMLYAIFFVLDENGLGWHEPMCREDVAKCFCLIEFVRMETDVCIEEKRKKGKV